MKTHFPQAAAKPGAGVTLGAVSAGLPAVVHAEAVSRRSAHVSLKWISRRILRSQCASSVSRSGRTMSAPNRATEPLTPSTLTGSKTMSHEVAAPRIRCTGAALKSRRYAQGFRPAFQRRLVPCRLALACTVVFGRKLFVVR
jgi:hypothetical protein